MYSFDKLLDLQSKYGNDRRFAMDERFYESGDETSPNGENKSNDNSNEKLETTEDEVKKQMEILQSIVGNSVPIRERRKQKPVEPALVRFDPSIPEHEKFIVNASARDDFDTSGASEKPKRKKGKNKRNGIDADETTNKVPIVSKETFYEVEDGLKESFKSSQKNSFSFSDMFRSSVGNNNKSNDIAPDNVNWTTKKPSSYDRFDNERFGGDFDDEKDKMHHKTNNDRKKTTKSLWTEKFFYARDDSRFEELYEFFSNTNKETEDFRTTRANLMGIVRKKVLKRTQKPPLLNTKANAQNRRAFKKFKRREFTSF